MRRAKMPVFLFGGHSYIRKTDIKLIMELDNRIQKERLEKKQTKDRARRLKNSEILKTAGAFSLPLPP